MTNPTQAGWFLGDPVAGQFMSWQRITGRMMKRL